MTISRSAVSIVPVSALLVLVGCAARLPPPPQPGPVVPRIDDPPDSPPAPGSGRVTLDVVGESAKVARVTETAEIVSGPYRPRSTFGRFVIRKTELLCTTPCVVDLPYGAHTLDFTSRTDETRTSTADVTVSKKPSVVRHALGKEIPASGNYVGGWSLIALGIGLTTFGAMATTVGLAAESARNDSATQTRGNPAAFVGIGLVTLGIGLATGTIGVVLAETNRPEHQPGSTLQFVP